MNRSHFSAPDFCPTLFCSAAFLACTSAQAENAATADLPGVSSAALLQSLLGLAMVIGLLMLGVFFLRKMNGGQGFGQRGPLRVVGGLSIGTRERIVVVEVGETWLLIGVSPGQISTLHSMPKGEITQNPATEKPFAHWLKQAGIKRDAPER